MEPLVVDGSYGPVTTDRVTQFQSMFAPRVDGVIGPITWHAHALPIFD